MDLVGEPQSVVQGSALRNAVTCWVESAGVLMTAYQRLCPIQVWTLHIFNDVQHDETQRSYAMLEGQVSSSMPWLLVLAWVGFFGFLTAHQRHAMRFQGNSELYLLALNISAFVGSLTGFALLGYYFTQVSWYWPIVLLLLGSLITGLLYVWLCVAPGQVVLSIIAFVGWPTFAVWLFFIISDLPH